MKRYVLRNRFKLTPSDVDTTISCKDNDGNKVVVGKIVEVKDGSFKAEIDNEELFERSSQMYIDK